MPKIVKEMSAIEVGRIKEVGFYPVGGVSGLCLQVVPSLAKSWVLRVMVGGKRRKMGLGGFPDVTLAQAREKARKAKEKISDGIDPIDDRKDRRKSLLASRAKDVTFKACCEDHIKAHSISWKNSKHAAQWGATLERYAYPIIGDLWVREVELSHIMQILQPIWLEKTQTAKRLRGRLESVLDSAFVKGLRDQPNPARWKGNLASLLPSPNKVKKVRHHPAVQLNELGTFMKDLRSRDGISAQALRFLCLTSVRSHNVRHASWSEIDFETKTWAIPGEDSDDEGGQRMKSGVAHRVPLSKQALELLESLPRVAGTDLLFPSPRKGVELTDMAMNAVMRQMDYRDANGRRAVPHGLRSTFKDWAMEHTNFQHEISEKALAHTVGDVTERAYLRSDAFKKRCRMMQMWADFCSTPCDAKGKKVVPFKSKMA